MWNVVWKWSICALLVDVGVLLICSIIIFLVFFCVLSVLSFCSECRMCNGCICMLVVAVGFSSMCVITDMCSSTWSQFMCVFMSFFFSPFHQWCMLVEMVLDVL